MISGQHRGGSAAVNASRVLIIVSLSFVGGFVDTASFIALFSLFTAYLTGNLAVLAAEVVHNSDLVAIRLVIIPVFIMTVIGTTLYVRHHAERGCNVLHHTLALEAVLLLVAFVVATLLGPPGSPDGLAMAIIAPCLVAAMAVQNAATRLTIPSGIATTLMTLNITQLTIDLVDLCRARGEAQARKQSRERTALLAGAITSFLVGAAGGAFGYHVASFWCLIVPFLILVILTLSQAMLAAAIGQEVPRSPDARPTDA
jgi:uncharacterized membrane protein YoaK (UPF0700 family)